MVCYVADRLLAQFQHGVVVLGPRVLDEQQGGRDRTPALAADNVRIDKRLQIVVRVLADVLRLEYGVHIGQRLHLLAARLVVHHADGAVVHQVKPVYTPAKFES